MAQDAQARYQQLLAQLGQQASSRPELALANLDKLVVKPANESGGYGLMVGPHASKAKRAEFAKLIEKDPRNPRCIVPVPRLGYRFAGCGGS